MDAISPTPLTGADRWLLAARRAGAHSLIVWPPLVVGWLLLVAAKRHALAFDFGHAYLPASHAVLAGHSPYPVVTVPSSFPGTAFIYPPLTAYLAAPFVLVPSILAESIVSALAIGLVLATLWLLEIRDWRCYTIAFLWVPVYAGIQTGNVMLLLTAGIALAWRYRDRPAVEAVATGALVALKLIAWPLLVWLVVTRRLKAAWGAALAAVVLMVVPWAGIGFKGMTGYPHLLRVLTEAERADAYSIPALLAGHVGWSAAEVVGLAVGGAVLAVAAWTGRRDERASFTLAVASMLLLTPIISMFYFVFLLVILALHRPRFGWAWALPLLFWLGPQVGRGVDWQTGAVLLVEACVVLVALQGPGSGRMPTPTAPVGTDRA